MVTIKSYQGGIVANPQSPVGVAAPQSAMGEELGRGLQKVGQALYDWQDEADTAQAKMADTKYADLIRNELYGDGTGFMYASGSDAMGRRGTVAERLKAAQDEMLAGLSPAARARAQTAIQSRYQGALQSVDQHTAGEGRTYLNDASQARITMFANDAIYKPDQASVELQRAEVEISDMAARNGWSPERTQLERVKMRTEVHGGIIARLENVDPMAALDYLGQHKDDMAGQEVARLERLLAPKVKEFKGRQAGAAAALSGVSPDYLSAIRSAESGGNDAAKNPLSSATGRYQFIESTWFQVMSDHPELGLTADGRLDPAQQELAIRAFTADNAKILESNGITATGGNLYAAHFLGVGGAKNVLTQPDDALVSDHVSKGVISANGFLEGMTVGDFRRWSSQKGGGSSLGFSNGVGGMDELLAIQDPEEQAAAIRQFNLIIAARDADIKAKKEAAGNAAFQIIEQGGMVDGLPSEARQYLGLDQMRELRGYEDTIRKGRKPITDDSLYVELSDMAARDPEAFMAADPILWRNQLDDADFQKFTDLRRNMITGTRTGTGSEASISAVRTSIKTVMEAAGIDGSKPAGAKTQLKLEADMLRWTEEFAKANDGRMPNAQEINKRAMAAVTPVTINPPGLNNEQAGYSFDINFAGQPVVQDGTVVRRNEITVETLTQSGVSIGGLTVPPGEIAAFAQEYVARYGVEPTPQEVIEGLAASGRYTQ